MTRRKTGRPKGMSKENIDKCIEVLRLYEEENYSIVNACKKVDLPRNNFYRWDKKRKEDK